MARAAASQAPTGDASCICYLVRRVHQQMIVSTSPLMPDGRHPRDIALLRVIAENAPVSQQWLGDYLAINRSVMVKLIDGLEARGDVVRERRVDDRRSYALRPSPAGRRTIKSLGAIIGKADKVVSGALSPDEHRRLVRLLKLVLNPHFDPPPPPDLADLIGWLIAQAHLRLEAAGDIVLAPIGLTVRTFVALAVLAVTVPCSQQDLATELDIGPAATVELVDELEQLGTVRRCRNPVDRRSYALELAPAGEVLLARARGSLSDAATEFTGMLSESERSELASLLAKLAGVAVVI